MFAEEGGDMLRERSTLIMKTSKQDTNKAFKGSFKSTNRPEIIMRTDSQKSGVSL